MEHDDDRAKVIAREMVEKSLDDFMNRICNPKHKIVDEIRNDVKKLSENISMKFNWLYLLLISTLVGIIVNYFKRG